MPCLDHSKSMSPEWIRSVKAAQVTVEATGTDGRRCAAGLHRGGPPRQKVRQQDVHANKSPKVEQLAPRQNARRVVQHRLCPRTPPPAILRYAPLARVSQGLAASADGYSRSAEARTSLYQQASADATVVRQQVRLNCGVAYRWNRSRRCSNARAILTMLPRGLAKLANGLLIAPNALILC
ncbi:hypothetical protein PF005_g898 [Phytophthora fragariae]|uniref:Uncharacterized protein n=1 Tax=Phytophthora fragariae TaxID=53985 RepID=A0A6A3FUB5_9STRA|nr:hypothetical protein PF003_g21099 [Phytophthora fragariae]KAE8949794.1 hypothetical protein PF009_g701 [Phytophthora fragariae]KAE9139055.1 hypothetical protein PF010_g751 [Phytophthora fragariae]KAE9140386.1 hypothetical protein PF007_g683 [Phytophthora fragariae]KAE9155378.1 hypothetical protein PF006_g667 [Phytophthora fragariae]